MSSSVVITGEVEAVEICGTPETLETLRATGMVTPLDRAPMTALTPSTETKRLAASTAGCGRVLVSPTSTVSLPPSTPPASLIWLTARLTPLSVTVP